MLQSAPSIESRYSWVVAAVALGVIATSFGAPWIAVVALKDIAAEVGGLRSIPALAGSLAWFGGGLGGIIMGRIAERVGVRWTVMVGGAMIAVGLTFATLGPSWQLQLGYGLFVGLIGIGGINAPLYVYVSQWFDRRRGSALALISSGGYLAGAFWPAIFERAISTIGWRQTMLWYALLEIAVIIPLAFLFLRPLPKPLPVALSGGAALADRRVIGWPPNLVYGMLAAAIFMCCVPMSMPQGHLVAFCTDLGISATLGATMLSVLLGCAFLSRQVWGLISDRIGGLRTVLICSACQVAAMTAFLLTQDTVGLFTVSAAFGLGFAGLIPAYVLAIREHFPVGEAYWRIPTLLLCSGSGMATGGWLAGYLYDYFGYYAPAFAVGIGINLLNLVIISTLVLRQRKVAARI
jgi:MFS family permease